MTPLRQPLARLSAAAALCCSLGVAQAGAIYSPIGAVIDAGGPGFGSIADTFDHHGLLSDFTSGVTDFAGYIAGNPLHSVLFNENGVGNEWFSNAGLSSAVVTYDLGTILSVSRLALWNEEGSGIGLLDLDASTDGVSFAPLAVDLVPTDHPSTPVPYGADVFSFDTTAARYIRFDMSACPSEIFAACSIGEVAFDATTPPVTAIPEPRTVALLATGLLALAIAARRRRPDA